MITSMILASKSLITDLVHEPVDEYANDIGLKVIHQDIINDIANDPVKDLVDDLGLQVDNQ